MYRLPSTPLSSAPLQLDPLIIGRRPDEKGPSPAPLRDLGQLQDKSGPHAGNPIPIIFFDHVPQGMYGPGHTFDLERPKHIPEKAPSCQTRSQWRWIREQPPSFCIRQGLKLRIILVDQQGPGRRKALKKGPSSRVLEKACRMEPRLLYRTSQPFLKAEDLAFRAKDREIGGFSQANDRVGVKEIGRRNPGKCGHARTGNGSTESSEKGP
jgi:hypothetical protein